MAWSKQFAKAFGEMWSKSGSGSLFSGAISKSKGVGEFQKTVVKALGGEKPFLNRFNGMSESQFKDTMASFADDLLEKRGIFANSNIVKDVGHAKRLRNNLSAYRQGVESRMTGEIENAVKVASTPKAPKINTGQTTVYNQSKPIEGTRIGSAEGKSTWKKPKEGPLDGPTNDANQAKARMQREGQAQGTAEGTATAEAQQTGASSSNNGSADKVPDSSNPTGNPEASTGSSSMDKAVNEANEQEKHFWQDKEANEFMETRLSNQKQEALVNKENAMRDLEEKTGISKSQLRVLKSKARQGDINAKNMLDKAKGKIYEERKGILKNYRNEINSIINDRKEGPDMMDWVRGHEYDKAAVGIGALGFAGSVAFGGAKSNADLYSNPF